MKILKKILALSFFIAFISAGTNANAAMLKNADCSNYKVLSHEWNSCKLGSKKYPPAGETSELANDESGEKSKKNAKQAAQRHTSLHHRAPPRCRPLVKIEGNILGDLGGR